MADEMMNGAKDTFKNVFGNKSIEIEAYKESEDMATENASGIMYNIKKKYSSIEKYQTYFYLF